MKIEIENGFLIYSVEETEIVLENIKSFIPKKGTGKLLLDFLKKEAIRLNLPISLYCYPQDETISHEDLKFFYFKNGFSLHKEDVDGNLMIY